MKTTTTKSNAKVNTEKEQLMKRILTKKKSLSPLCMSICESH